MRPAKMWWALIGITAGFLIGSWTEYRMLRRKYVFVLKTRDGYVTNWQMERAERADQK